MKYPTSLAGHSREIISPLHVSAAEWETHGFELHRVPIRGVTSNVKGDSPRNVHVTSCDIVTRDLEKSGLVVNRQNRSADNFSGDCHRGRVASGAENRWEQRQREEQCKGGFAHTHNYFSWQPKVGVRTGVGSP
jgi:hypothetical protein